MFGFLFHAKSFVHSIELYWVVVEVDLESLKDSVNSIIVLLLSHLQRMIAVKTTAITAATRQVKKYKSFPIFSTSS